MFYSIKNISFLTIVLAIVLIPLGSVLQAEVLMNAQTTAVRYVFTASVEREHYSWLKKNIANQWFSGESPKICHICDNVYRYPTDNGSVLTRGVLNMMNRKKLAAIMEVKTFLSVVFRQTGENIQVERTLYNLKKNDPVSAKVFQWSKSWLNW